MYFNTAPILFLPLSDNQTALNQVVDNQSHISAALEDLGSQLTGLHWPQVIDGLEYAELARSQIVLRQMPVDAIANGVRGAREFYVRVEGQFFLLACADILSDMMQVV